MEKRKWYMWLSIFAFMILYATSARKVLATKPRNFDLWLRLCGHIFVVAVSSLFLPIGVAIFLKETAPVYPPYLKSFLTVFQFVVLYFGGVWASYRHIKWREKYLGK